MKVGIKNCNKQILGIFILIAIIFVSIAFKFSHVSSDDIILSYTVNPQKKKVKLYWKNENGEILQTFSKLKEYTKSKGKTLLFAMNAGMYKTDFSPLGLYIENGIKKNKLNTRAGKGNFYLMPNGVFYMTDDNKPHVCKTQDFKQSKNIKYATQSGPMLAMDGKIHPAFKEGSANVNIRNGVGVLPDQTLVFAMSKKKINLYDFAMFFKKKGCKNALYLDGFVSRVYWPEKKWIQTDGNFGVMIGVTD